MLPMKRFTIETATEGNSDVVNLQQLVGEHVKKLKGDGLVHLFVIGSTAALTTIEYEPGLVKHDVATAFQKLVPDDATYQHEATWHDDNGHSHIRSSLVGPSLTVPYSAGKLLTGDYQQIVLVDFDTRPRRRKVIGTIVD